MARKKNARQASITNTKDDQDLKHRFYQEENRQKANQIYLKQG